MSADSTEPTVADVADYGWRSLHLLKTLGIDTDMTVTRLRKLIEMGKRAEKLTMRDVPSRTLDLHPSDYVNIGFNTCLDHIRGES